MSVEAENSQTHKPSRPHVTPRRLARVRAVQLLYQMEMTKTAPDQAMQMMVEPSDKSHKTAKKIDENLFRHLVAASAIDPGAIDRVIAESLPAAWSLERLDAVLRAVLRVAVLELKSKPDIPPLVTITEYVAVAHAFFGGKEPAMVHGVLNHVAHILRPAELPDAK